MRYNFDFLQTGGVPLTNDLMSLIEEAYGIFEALGDLSGNLTILSGCEILGTNVNPGIVAIEGKLYYFEGGQISSTVYIHTEEIQKIFQDTSTKTLIYKKTVKFGSAITSYTWNDFVKLKTLKEIQEKVDNSVNQDDFDALVERVVFLELKTAPIQNGMIFLPFKRPVAEIPAGWKECTDFAGKILVGRDPNDNDFKNLAAEGGNKTITQTLAQMPKHKHSYTRTSPWSSGSGGGFSGGGNQFNIANIDTSEAGNGEPMDIMNPYRVVNYIEPNFQ